MSKYDYGYELVEGTTTAWAYEKIRSGNTVLEFGPAIGNLAKHLYEEKRCSIDIVEIDEEAGIKAARFARTSILGKDGDLDGENWFERLQENRYDYIVILDVVEHIHDGEKLLRRARKLLKDDGKLLISMPNVAHNSVLINLFNNKFIYTKDGLLDNTHLKFYTYSSFYELICKCEYKIVSKEAKQIPVGMNEVNALYGDVPKAVELFLRTRPLADVYQFLFVLQKGEQSNCLDEIDFHLPLLSETLFKLQVYFDGKAENEIEYYCDPQNIELTVKVDKQGYEYVRIDPVEYKCVLQILSIEGKTESGSIALDVYETNGIDIGNNIYFYSKDDPNFCVKLSDEITEIYFKCKCYEINSDMMDVYHLIAEKEKVQLELLKKSEEENALQNSALEQYKKDNVLLNRALEQYKKDNVLLNSALEQYKKDSVWLNSALEQCKLENTNLEGEISLLQNENLEIKVKLNSVMEELARIKRTKIYKLYKLVKNKK